ncbi:phage virion morphogenesis protein [Comamonas sp. NLF-1-9]|uniref:phage virion morphogenesis protein n=1 Tax=Comamonas sp. NLF-1-9 TaxID=2853163 RepID=UPI001C4688F5|nr:phage virion morphogenesis protein [Comamonas sp. NLF-1-9]QXL84131.1 phage virion morphogenesis protein [Comamonas sp. NLF-1-9]
MLTIDVKDSGFRQYLADLQARLGDLTGAMQAIGQEMENRIKARFETETDPDGEKWEKWSDYYAEHYPKDGNHRILDRYSPGAASLLGSLNWDADTTSVLVGFGQHYATFHEFGTWKMPRRGLLFQDPESGRLAPADEQAVIDILQDWLLPD